MNFICVHQSVFQDFSHSVVKTLSKREHPTKSMSNPKPNAGSYLPPSKKHCPEASIFQDSLSEAAKFCQMEKVLFFLKKGAKVHFGKKKDPNCGHNCEIETPIEEAVKANHHDIILILFKNLDKSKVNLQCMVNRLLILAAQFAGKDIVFELIKMGAELNPNIRYLAIAGKLQQEEIPLQVAIKNQNLEVIKVLLANGADPNHKEKYDYIIPSLDQALETGNLKIIQMLLENGANEKYLFTEALESDALKSSDATNSFAIIEMLLKYDVEVNVKDDEDMTPLHHAIINIGNEGIASLLIGFGADINAKDDLLNTPLLLAYLYRGRNLKLIKLLMENGANPNLKDDEGNSTIEYTLTHGASAVKHFKVIVYNQGY